MLAIGMLFATNETKAQDLIPGYKDIKPSPPVSLGFNAGYSWLQGVIGAELEYGNWAVGGGYYPAKMPGSGESVASISWFVTYQSAVFQKSSGYYASIGMASAGYRYQESWNGGSWGNDIIAPMWIGMIGYKYNWYSGLNLKGGVGYGWCEYAGVFTWEVTLGYKFGL